MFENGGVILKKLSPVQWGLLFILLIYAVILSVEYARFQQLPSPVYGGDLYHQLGAINHVKYGGNPFAAFSTVSSTPSYLPMYALIVGNFARLLNLPGISAMYICSVVFMILSLVLVYLVFKRLFGSGLIALFGALAFIPLERGILKYTEFATFLGYPLFFFALICFFQANKWKWLYAWLTGLAYGFLSISHAMGFFISTMFMPLILLYILLLQYWKTGGFNWKQIKSELVKNAGYFALILLPGLLIAQIYWFPFFTRHISGVSFEAESYVYTLSSMLNQAIGTIVAFDGPRSAFISILLLAAILLPVFARPKDESTKTTILSVIIFGVLFLIIPFHFILTKPLFGLILIPNHMLIHAYQIFRALFACLGIYYISFFLSEVNIKRLAFGFIVILLAFNIQSFASWYTTNRWVGTGMLPLGSPLIDAADWIIANTGVNDVFLTTKETSSAMNALTGRKFVSLRYSNMDPTLSFMDREADVAIILYGNDDAKRVELLKKYNVKYFYWDIYWYVSEFIFDEQGMVIDFFDPLMVLANEKNIKLFEQYNITYVRQQMPLDPAKRGVPDIELLDLLVVLPKNDSETRPWISQFERHIQPIMGWQDSQQPVATIFRVR